MAHALPLRRRLAATVPILAIHMSLAGAATAGAGATAPGAGAPTTGPAAATPDEGDDQYRFLVGLIERGLYEKAVSEATAFLRDHSDHAKAPLARYRLGTALFELERWDEAADQFEALGGARRFEYRAESLFRLGQCRLSRERLRDATRAFEAVLELDQDYLHGPATFFLAETAFRAGRTDEAEQRYAELLRDHSGSEHVAGARRGLTWCAWTREDVPETVRRAREYLRHHGEAEGADEVRVLLGEALLEAGEPREALEAFEGARAPAFRDAALRGAGFAHAALEDPGRAAAAFAALLEEHPESRFAAEARLQLGIQTLRAGDARAAVRALRPAVEAGDPEAALWLAQAEAAAGDEEAALRTLNRALQSGPEEELAARIQIARGDLLAELGRTEAAQAAYESGGSDYALYAAAVAGLNRGDGANAIRLVQKLFEEHPRTSYRSAAFLVLGEAHFAASELEPAQAAFESVLSANPNPAEAAQAVKRIGWCRYLSGDPQGAAQRFAEVVESHPDGAEAEEALYMLGRARLEAGDSHGAHEAIERYLRRYPEGPHGDEVLLAAARDEGPEGATKDGARLLEELLARYPESPLVPRALLELGDRASAAGRFEEAAPRYAAILEDHAGADVVPEAGYGLAWCRYQLGDPAHAAALLDRVATDRAASEELRAAAWELAVWAHAKSGDPQAATAALRGFDRACDDDARVFDAGRTVVAAWRDAGRPRQGQAVLDELLGSLEDEEVAVGILLEGTYLALEQGELDRADAHVQVALRRDDGSPQARRVKPEVAEACFFVAEARFSNEENERAIALYRAAASEQSPLRADALYKLGFVLLRTGDPEEAEKALVTLVDEHPTSELFGESLFLLGEARFRRGDHAGCVDALERLRREAPRHEVMPKALFRLGIALARLERWDACEAALAELARTAPEFPNLAEAELWRGRALAATRKPRAARQAFERVGALDRGQLAAQAHLGLGGLLEDEGRIDDALSEYLKVAVLFAHDEEVAEALYRAGTCLERLGDASKALEQYDEVVARYADSNHAARARERIRALRTQ